MTRGHSANFLPHKIYHASRSILRQGDGCPSIALLGRRNPAAGSAFEWCVYIFSRSDENMEPILLPETNRRWDCFSLGEVMLRLDPGEGRIHTTRQFAVWEGGGEYNVARGLRRCFGLRTAVATALADNAVGRLVEDLHPAGRRRHLPPPLGPVRRRGPHRSQWAQFHRARIRRTRRRRLQRSRPHRHQPGQARRLRLGFDFWRGKRFALVSHRRHFCGPFRLHGRRGRRSHGRGAQRRDAHFFRPQLS